MNGERPSILIAGLWLYPAAKGGVAVTVRTLIDTLPLILSVTVSEIMPIHQPPSGGGT